MRGPDGAATKIQAGFRGYRVRKQLRLAQIKGKRADTNLGGRGQQAPSKGVAPASTKAPATAVAAAAVIGCGSSPASEDPTAASPDANASPVVVAQLDHFATKIQAGVRGFLVRRKHLHQTRAATTIQATFRAFRARREARLRAAAKL